MLRTVTQHTKLLWPLYWTTPVKYWRVLLEHSFTTTCPCWRQPARSD